MAVEAAGFTGLGVLQKSSLLSQGGALWAPDVDISPRMDLGLTEALQKSVCGESCSLGSDPVPFSLLPVAQKVVALRKKQQLSIGPCKSLPNSPSHSSVSAASIPSVHINQVGNGSGESWGSHMLLCTPSVLSTHRLALDSHHSPGAASGRSRDLSPWCFCLQPRAA